MPNYCFDGGFCIIQFIDTSDYYRAVCNGSFTTTDLVQKVVNGVDTLCSLDNYLGLNNIWDLRDHFTEPLVESIQSSMTLELCTGVGSCGGFQNFNFTIYPRPTFVSSTLSVYDSIIHEFIVEGDNLNSLYKPNITVSYTQSTDCQFNLICDPIDAKIMKCKKNIALTDSCLVQLDQSKIEATTLWYSHSSKQEKLLGTLSIYRVPSFGSLTWDPSMKKFYVKSSSGQILTKLFASCYTLDFKGFLHIKTELELISEGQYAFAFETLDVGTKTFNCSIILDKTNAHIPIGVVNVYPSEESAVSPVWTFLKGNTLLLVSGTIFMIVSIIGTIKIILSRRQPSKSSKNARSVESFPKLTTRPSKNEAELRKAKIRNKIKMLSYY